MSATKTEACNERVLVLAPTGRDARLVATVLAKAGVACEICEDLESLGREIDAGAGAVLITEEALEGAGMGRLVESLERQPPWSDLPVLTFVSREENAEAVFTGLGTRTNTTILERPVRVAMLRSAVHAALRARRRQYQTRDLLAELEVADRQKDAFLATVSHELRTPLNSMVGWIQILRGREDDKSLLNRGLETIDRNARAQAKLVDDLLDISRIISGKMRLNVCPVELDTVIVAALESVRPSAAAKGVRIESVLDAQAARVSGDPERLQQIVWNLLTNAIKFTPRGGRVEVSVEYMASHVALVVSDTGKGIDPAFLPFIFDRFRQADASRTRAQRGLGLGLAIVRHLVELHGGTIEAWSEGTGRGATFMVVLPILTPRPRNGPRESERSASAGGQLGPLPNLDGARVLVVDDDLDTREMLTVMLHRLDASVRTAASAAEALDIISRWRPEILLSDIGMPDEDGYSLMRKVRGLAPTEGGQTPAVALTAYAREEDANESLRAGFQHHLVKPVRLADLVAVLASLVGPNQRA